MYKKLVVLMTIPMLLSFVNFVKADASDVSLTLCSDSQKEFMLDSGEGKEYCFRLNNGSDREYKIIYGFTESIINDIGKQLCNGAPSSGNYFARMFTHPEPKEVIIKWWESKEINEKIMVPVGMTWTVYGCISYTVNEPVQQSKWSIFAVVISRILPIKIFIGKMADIVNDIQLVRNKWGVFTTNNKIKAKVDENGKLVVSFLVENKGNIEQDVAITGSVYNIFWFEKEFTATAKKVGAGETSEFTANIGIIPFYRWFFTIQYTMQNTPSFGFNSVNLDEKYTKGGYTADKGNIYIFSWITLIIIIVVLLFIYKFLSMSFKSKKVEQ